MLYFTLLTGTHASAIPTATTKSGMEASKLSVSINAPKFTEWSDYTTTKPKVPAKDDTALNELKAFCLDRHKYAYGWEITFEWYRMYCEGKTVVIVCMQKNGKRTFLQKIPCRVREKGFQRDNYINPFRAVVSTAGCVPDLWARLVQHARHVRGRFGELMYGQAMGLHPPSYWLATSMIDLTVHVSRVGADKFSAGEDIKAQHIFPVGYNG